MIMFEIWIGVVTLSVVLLLIRDELLVAHRCRKKAKIRRYK